MQILKEKLKQKSGITLIALVVTIIILIILAAVSINVVFGQNGIIARAQYTKVAQREATAEEELKLKIIDVQVQKNGSASLLDLLNEFKKEERTDIDVIDVVSADVATISYTGQLPIKPKEITVVLERFNEFDFTLDENLSVIKICGLEKDEWYGQEVKQNNIEISATPSTQIDSYVIEQNIGITAKCSNESSDWGAKYGWSTSSSQEPNTWKTLTLEGSNTERTGEIVGGESTKGDYYLWVKVTVDRKTKREFFGPYKMSGRPTEDNLVCVMIDKDENEIEGTVTVGSNMAFDGWTCTYQKNSETPVEIEVGKTTNITVVKDDVVTVKYSRSGQTDVTKTLNATELKRGYILSYDVGEGTGAPDSVTQYDNATFTISSTTPTREGYKFAGWNTKSDFTGTNYNSGSSITVSSSSTTLYAKWQKEVTAKISTDVKNLVNGTNVVIGTDDVILSSSFKQKIENLLDSLVDKEESLSGAFGKSRYSGSYDYSYAFSGGYNTYWCSSEGDTTNNYIGYSFENKKYVFYASYSPSQSMRFYR